MSVTLASLLQGPSLPAGEGALSLCGHAFPAVLIRETVTALPRGQSRRDQALLPGLPCWVSGPSTVLTILTSWALPVVAAGSEGHRALIRDFRVGLLRDVLPPAAIRHHVVMNLLERESNHISREQLLGLGNRADSCISSRTPPAISYLTGSQLILSSERLWSEWLITLGEN